MSKQYGIRVHVAWLTLLPLLVMVTGLEIFLLHDRFTDMDRYLKTRGELIAAQLAASSEYGVFSNNRVFLKTLADNALSLPDVRSVAVMNANSTILVASGQRLPPLDDKATLHAGDRLKRVNLDLFEQGHTLKVYQPIVSTQIALDELDLIAASNKIGTVVVEMSRDSTDKLKSDLFWLTLLVTSLFLLVTLYLVNLASRRIVVPIKKLSEAIKLIGGGNLEVRVNAPSRITELCTLTVGINQMTADLQHERDILQQRIEEATLQLRELAFYDPLTKLPNRRLLNDRLAKCMASGHRGEYHSALMFIDLDNFKPLNDQFGHETGDLLLIEVASRISSCLREVDTVARFGGDEFVVMLDKLCVDYDASVQEAKIVAEKIRCILSEKYNLNSKMQGMADIRIDHQCSCSIGVVVFAGHEAIQEEILSRADMAMYRAKHEGRNRICVYDRLWV